MTFTTWQIVGALMMAFGLGGLFAVLVWPRRR